ncbi:MAG: hypothetical protein P1U40_03105 [Coxiellaceae bacterium]|nr:hypothetical protein [Coxiellaceae bacterium]
MRTIQIVEISLTVDEMFFEFLNTDDPYAFTVDQIRPSATKGVMFWNETAARKRSARAEQCNLFMPPVIYPLSICILFNKIKHAKWLYESFDLELASDQYQVFRLAVRYGRLDAIQQMVAWSPREYDGIREEYKYKWFAKAAKHGYLDIMQELRSWQRTPATRAVLITANDFSASTQAARMGRLDVLLQLVEWLPNTDLQRMIASNNFSAFYFAASSGHVDMVRHLIKWANAETLTAMLEEGFFDAIRRALTNGHSRVMMAIFDLVPKELFDKAIKACIDVTDIKSFVLSGHFNMLKHFYEWSTVAQRIEILEFAREPVRYDEDSERNLDDSFYGSYCVGEYLETLDRLEELFALDDKVQDFLKEECDLKNKEAYLYALDQRMFKLPSNDVVAEPEKFLYALDQRLF